MLQSPRANWLQALLHFIFFLSGIATVLIGPMLPIFARQFNLNDLQVSFFFPSQFAGSLIGTFFTSRLARRNNYMAASMLGGAAMAVGFLLININLFAVCLSGIFISGIGIGMTLPAINMLIIEINPKRSAPALNILNFCWGLGAICCKPFVDYFSSPGDVGLTTIVLSVPLLLASLLLRLSAGPSRNEVPIVFDVDADDFVPIWRTPLAWAIALFNFVHVGFESGMGGWLPTYTERIQGKAELRWLSPTLLFYLFFVAGRGCAPLLLKFLNENKMLMLGLLIVLGGVIWLVTAESVFALGVASSIAGFGTSWIFPTNVSRFSNTFGRSSTRRATPLFVAGTLGAVSSTWLIGSVSNYTGSLRSGMYVLAVGVVFLIMMQVLIGRRKGAVQ